MAVIYVDHTKMFQIDFGSFKLILPLPFTGGVITDVIDNLQMSSLKYLSTFCILLGGITVDG